MKTSQEPTSTRTRALASAVERDLRALVELLSRQIDGHDEPHLVPIRASAQRGLELAQQIQEALDPADEDPAA